MQVKQFQTISKQGHLNRMIANQTLNIKQNGMNMQND